MNIKLVFQIGTDALVTSRTLNTTFIVLLSSMLGSIAGILAIVGRVLVTWEKNFKKVKTKIEVKSRIKKLNGKAKNLKLQTLRSKNLNKSEDSIIGNFYHLHDSKINLPKFN